MTADGRLGGALWLFGAVPPVPVVGEWWVEGDYYSELVWDFEVTVAIELVRMQFSYPQTIVHRTFYAIDTAYEGGGMRLRRPAQAG